MSKSLIPLGFAVGTGEPVFVPLKHLAITGQTQEAGKTTALEALITRSGLRALTFVTKRGEGAFTAGRPTAPYFREQADWRFVSSLLEAFLGERMKFERSWIMRATKGARTLADVRGNVSELLLKARGLSADVYMVLGEYLDELVPVIAEVAWAPRVTLAAGVNVMDLAAVPSSMQHLVIKSALDWVLEHEVGTVVVIPEAWKFVPQGRGTPVKLSAMAYIRQGAALGNYLWLDSQDLGGVDKELLRSVPLWILGVQREANEIKRTLSNIPAGIAKPTPATIATLELGQFFACWSTHAIATYVQPVWSSAETAKAIARGEVSVDVNRALERPLTSLRAIAQALTNSGVMEATVTKDEAARLQRENETLLRQNAELRNRIEELEKGAKRDVSARGRPIDRAGDPQRSASPSDRDGAPEARTGGSRDRGGSTRDGSPAAAAARSNGHVDEATYQAIRARIVADEAILLKVAALRPELVVEVTPRVVQVEGDTAKGRVARLMAAGWFDTSRAVGAVRSELARTGKDPGGGGALGIMLNNFVADGFFVREGGGFVLAPGVKVSERELRVS